MAFFSSIPGGVFFLFLTFLFACSLMRFRRCLTFMFNSDVDESHFASWLQICLSFRGIVLCLLASTTTCHRSMLTRFSRLYLMLRITLRRSQPADHRLLTSCIQLHACGPKRQVCGDASLKRANMCPANEAKSTSTIQGIRSTTTILLFVAADTSHLVVPKYNASKQNQN